MEQEGGKFERKEGATKIVEISFHTYGISKYFRVPLGLDVEMEQKEFIRESKKDPSINKDELEDIIHAFYARLVALGAEEIQIDEYHSEEIVNEVMSG